MNDLIKRQAAIDECYHVTVDGKVYEVVQVETLMGLPSVQPEIIQCRDCIYGEQDEVGRWFCNDLGCQIGNEDGSWYCADAERRTNG